MEVILSTKYVEMRPPHIDLNSRPSKKEVSYNSDLYIHSPILAEAIYAFAANVIATHKAGVPDAGDPLL